MRREGNMKKMRWLVNTIIIKVALRAPHWETIWLPATCEAVSGACGACCQETIWRPATAALGRTADVTNERM